MHKIKVVQVGFGSLGVAFFKTLVDHKKIKVVGIIDTDPNKIGKDAGFLTAGKKNGVRILKDLQNLRVRPDLAVVTTTSKIREAYGQIYQILKQRISVITTCEELVYPKKLHQKIAKKIDLLAKRNRVVVLGVGVNPGFVMDSLVITLSTLCSKIKKISVTRVVNLAKRRKTLQNKMLVGMTATEFRKNKTKIGHVGLKESAQMIADSLNIKLNLKNSITPILAETAISSNGINIKPKRICGIKHTLCGKKSNSKFLEMSLLMYVGAKDCDMIKIEGEPPIQIKTNGINGDKATISLLLNYIPKVLKSRPGLRTVNELPNPRFVS